MDQRKFRDAMGKFATGITVVTTEIDGEVHGITVNAFMSVSLDPMLVLVSIDETASMFDKIKNAKNYAISFLKNDQKDYSMIFANQIKEDQPIEFDRLDGQPILKDALASVSCELYDSVKAGDHMLFIGKVTDIQINDGDPLLYFGGSYRELK